MAKDGVEYYVRKNKKPLDFADVVPIYIGKDGKLKKTDSLATMWF